MEKKYIWIQYEPENCNWTKFLYPNKLSLEPGRIVVNYGQELHIDLNHKIIMKLHQGMYDIDDLNKKLKDITGQKNTKDGLYDLVFISLSR